MYILACIPSFIPHLLSPPPNHPWDRIGEHTNTNRNPAEREPSQRILEEVWPASTQESSTGAVVFPVV